MNVNYGLGSDWAGYPFTSPILCEHISENPRSCSVGEDTMRHCIIYTSSLRALLREADLLSLLQQSRRDNAEANITGILLFVQGSIIQVLEGDERVIDALYKKIEQDQRHTNVTKVFSRPIQQRSFPSWSMGYKTISRHQLEIIKTIIDLENVEWLTIKPSDNIIINILKAFYEDSIYN